MALGLKIGFEVATTMNGIFAVLSLVVSSSSSLTQLQALSEAIGLDDGRESIGLGPGLLFASLWIAIGVGFVLYGRWLRSIPFEERRLRPRWLSVTLFLQRPLFSVIFGAFLGAGGVVLAVALILDRT